MKALCWMGKSNVEVHDVADPVLLNPHDAILKVTRTAICGSDLHLFDGIMPTMWSQLRSAYIDVEVSAAIVSWCLSPLLAATASSAARRSGRPVKTLTPMRI